LAAKSTIFLLKYSSILLKTGFLMSQTYLQKLTKGQEW
jgi:hypothetical protein